MITEEAKSMNQVKVTPKFLDVAFAIVVIAFLAPFPLALMAKGLAVYPGWFKFFAPVGIFVLAMYSVGWRRYSAPFAIFAAAVVLLTFIGLLSLVELVSEQTLIKVSVVAAVGTLLLPTALAGHFLFRQLRQSEMHFGIRKSEIGGPFCVWLGSRGAAESNPSGSTRRSQHE